MSDIAIKVENLSKRYKVWKKQAANDTLRDALTSIASAPLYWFDSSSRQKDDVFWALDEVSFEVKHGEAVGIIGRNGAGKSTLMKILSRITKPTKGRVEVFGRVGSLLEVGTGFHSELSGRENIYLNGAILGMKRDEIQRKFDEIVAFADIENFLDTPAKHYSSGMYMRLAFAVAAHLEPEILIVDEVLSVGDAEFQKKCLGKMREVTSAGRTVLFVSHNMGAIDNLCDKGILIEKGKVTYTGDQNGAITRYLNNSYEKQDILHNIDHRKGSGVVKFKKIEFHDEAGQVLEVVRSGQTVDISLFFETHEGYKSELDIHVYLRITTLLGLKVFSQNTRIAKKSFKNLEKSGVFVCRIQKLPLPPSTYEISCAVRVGNRIADEIDGAVQLNVVEGDFYKSGWTLTGDLGMILVDGDWRMEVG